MHVSCRSLLLVALAFGIVSPLRAQTAVSPAGHWEGSVQLPGSAVPFELDVAKDAGGQLAGAITIPSQKLRGLPLTKIEVDGRTVAFQARADQPFRGTVSDDGREMTGDFLVNGNSLPFAIDRTGDAKLEPPAKSAPIAAALEGTWNGTLAANGMALRLVLTLANQPGGFALGRLVNLDEGALEIPVVVTQHASSVTIETTVVASSASLTLNTAGTELTGTFTQGPFSAPLTFRRAQ